MQRFKGVGAYATVGLDFAVAIVIGILGGHWLDKKLDTLPWVTIIGLLFGVAAGFNLLFKAARRMREEFEREQTERHGESNTEGDNRNGRGSNGSS